MSEWSPSRDYSTYLREAQRYQLGAKTWSGKLLRPHAPFIKELIDQYKCQTALDYGCGKGEQYYWVSTEDGQAIPKGATLERYWGLKVSKYDPAVKRYQKEPIGFYDLVICTHVLRWIAPDAVDAVIDRLMHLSTKVVYISEKLGELSKNKSKVYAEGVQEDRTRQQWVDLIRPHSKRYNRPVMLATRELIDGASIWTRDYV